MYLPAGELLRVRVGRGGGGFHQDSDGLSDATEIGIGAGC